VTDCPSGSRLTYRQAGPKRRFKDLLPGTRRWRLSIWSAVPKCAPVATRASATASRPN